jgi:hypothetical protein
VLIRDIIYCKPGKVRPMVEIFLKVAKLYEESGLANIRVLTDICAERYWTMVAEIEVESLKEYIKMENKPEISKKLGEIMEGYHDLVDNGRREIYTIES